MSLIKQAANGKRQTATGRRERVFWLACLFAFLFLVGCKKDDYFDNTGVHTPNFEGTIMDYLKSKPTYFDSITKIIHLAGMDDVFSKEEITFFSPADSCVKLTIEALNRTLATQGTKQVFRLEQIKPSVWREQLSRYIFKGRKSMNDYPQIDAGNLSAYPGQIYASYDGLIMNVGVSYGDAGGVRYAGYRQLRLAYIPSPSAPRDFNSWYSVTIASVNIAPTNGYVHALKYPGHYFGFEPQQFIESAISKGID